MNGKVIIGLIIVGLIVALPGYLRFGKECAAERKISQYQQVKIKKLKHQITCISNLMQIQCALGQAQLNGIKKPTMEDALPYIKHYLKCPAGGSYSIYHNYDESYPVCTEYGHDLEHDNLKLMNELKNLESMQ